jgi:glycosyltransferase involved in cell wall biosynthesis/GT2 family glycosyltransferase
MTTTVSVIVPCYNGRRWIDGCLQSLADQQRPAEEIVFVDDGSTDGSADQLARWQDRLPALKIVSQPNRGLSAARNAGIAAACGELLALLDIDDRFEPDKLARQVEMMRDHPAIDLGFTDFAFVDEANRVLELRGLDRHPLMWKQRWKQLGPDRYISEDDSLEWMIRDSFMATGTWLIRADAWGRLGPFDEAVRNGEDLEFVVRWLKTGAKLGLLYQPLSRITLTANSLCRGNLSSWGWRIALTKRFERDYPDRLTPSERRALHEVRAHYQLGLAYHYARNSRFLLSRQSALDAIRSGAGWTAWKYLLKTLPALRLLAPTPSSGEDAEAGSASPRVNRVTFVNHYATLGGGEQALLTHAEDVQRRGVKPRVLLFEPGPFLDWLAKDGIEIGLMHHNPTPSDDWRKHHRIAAFSRGLLDCLRTKPHAVWFYTLAELFRLPHILSRLGCPLLYRAQAELTASLAQGYVKDWQVRLFLQSLDHIATTTQGERELLLRFGADPRKVRYIPLGIDTERFHPAPREQTATLTLGMFGRLVDWKGHDVLLHALARCGTDLPWRLMIVGDATSGQPDREQKLREIAEPLGLGDRIDWLGFREDVSELMRQCDILVHCSHREPFGLVIAEGMASGLCVLATDVSGPREIITPGKDGLLYPPGDVDALSQLLRNLMEHPARRSELARNARPAIERSFSLQSSMDALWDLTRQAVEEKRHP